MFLFPLLTIIVIIWLVVFFMNTLTTNSHNSNGSNSSSVHKNATNVNRPMEILKERYAKGEISEEEYLKIKRNLE